jgi:hypothetical protein
MLRFLRNSTTENPKTPFVVIVASGLVSGNYDNGGGVSDINAVLARSI